MLCAIKHMRQLKRLTDMEEQTPQVREAYESLRVIREVMDRSTRHSTLSGWSGIVVGVWALLGCGITWEMANGYFARYSHTQHIELFVATWCCVLIASALTDYVLAKKPAALVGKHVMSPLGARFLQAAAPAFVAGLAITVHLLLHGQLQSVWAYWMVCYGAAITSVGIFSMRPVSYLGWAFIVAGAITFLLPSAAGLPMTAIAFGMFHIVYGAFTYQRRQT